MKETLGLGDEDRKDLVNYRLQRAKETLAEAEYIAAGNFFNAAVNRLYYAAYYAASALMIAHHITATTHSGVRSMLGLKFIKPGKLDQKYGKTFMSLFENRQSGDYEDFVYCDLDLYNKLKPQTEDFIAAVSLLIS